jgi:hypothetical protein
MGAAWGSMVGNVEWLDRYMGSELKSRKREIDKAEMGSGGRRTTKRETTRKGEWTGESTRIGSDVCASLSCVVPRQSESARPWVRAERTFSTMSVILRIESMLA